MNKYAATAILAEALERGKRFVIIERDQNAIRDALHVFAAVVESVGRGDDVKVRRANGAERVDMLGLGTIRFATPHGNRMRGLSVDVVFLDNDAHRAVFGDDFMALDRFRSEMAATLAASGGEVVCS